MTAHLIIGAGVAGIAAAEAVRAADPGASITVATEDPFGYYSRPGLAYYLTGELSEEQLFPFRKSDFQALGLSWVAARAERIDPALQRVFFEGGSSLPYDRLLIASGSQAVPLAVPGADLNGVYKLYNMRDSRAILAGARKAREAVVVGGGITALELVEGLRARKLKVHYFLRGERYWSNVLDEVESRIVEQHLVGQGVRLHTSTELVEVLGKNGRVTGVLTKSGETIACELLAYAVGVQPRKELAERAGLRVERGILVDEHMRTSDPHIYAAGDAAQVYDPFSGRSVLDTLWNTARAQGQAAGSNMAGRPAAYRKSVPLNVTRLAGLTTTIIGTVGRGSDPSLVGIARGDSETWRHLPDAIVVEHSADVHRVRLLFGEDHLLGAVVMGDQTLSRPLQELIGAQAETSALRDVLQAEPESARAAEQVLAFWTQWRAQHAGARS